jgi:uncharacterized RDD family membrane protein YckC
MNWYYVEQGQQMGPVTEEQLGALYQAGKINGETLVWREGMANWSAYRETPAGAQSLQAMPNAATAPLVGSALSTGEAICAECGKIFPATEMIRYGSAYVCAGCKPVFLQKLSEGAKINTGQLPYARVLTRFAAIFLDGLMLGVVNVTIGTIARLLILGGSRAPSTGFMVLQMVLFVVNVCIGMTYEAILIGKYGATLGKMACKIKVVTADGGRVGYGRAFGRYFAKMLSGCTLMIGYIIAIFDSEKRALHDHICNTRVIYK